MLSEKHGGKTMSVFMTEDKKQLIVTCNCKCGQSFHIYIYDEDDEYFGFLCFMDNSGDSEYLSNPWRAFVVKMKKLWYIIKGMDYHYSDTMMTKADFEVFKQYVNQF